MMFQFSYTFPNLNVCFKNSIQVELKLDFPTKLNTDELMHRLLSLNASLSDLILYNETDHAMFKSQLNEFIHQQNQLFYDDLYSKSLNNFDKNTVKIYWSKVFNSNQVPKQTFNETNSGLINAKEYHKLMHSHLMNIIIEREKEYALQLNKLLIESSSHNLARIQRLKREQKAKFHALIKALNEHYETKSSNLDQILSSLSLDLDLDYDLDFIRHEETSNSLILKPSALSLRQIASMNSLHKLEESYTIQLGAQLKTTHNLRLIRCNIYDFCSNRFDQQQIEPHAIQTALSLYSNKLCALVLLTKNNAQLEDEFAANWSRLTQICDSNGCEFHFQSIEEQKESALKLKSSHLNIGDFFVTKHSNLAEVHVVFHLSAFDHDDTNLKVSDLSSRHPVILGMRNILKECVLNDIQTLTFPLLLTHEMTEEMTISWVMRRAEIVLKCIKGFMIEFVNWGAQESRTLQFVVPQGLMDETFDSLRTLIPTIFRESRTVNLV